MAITSIVFYFLYFFIRVYSLNPEPKIEFIDVGHGDSALITTAKGSKILIDGGGNYEADEFLGKSMPPGFCHLDVVVLSHPHADHLFGLTRVLNNCEVGVVFYNAVAYDSTMYDDWNSVLATNHVSTKSLYAGDSFSVDELDFYVVWPEIGYEDENVNNLSIVVLVDRGNFEALFLGDTEVEALAGIAMERITSHIEDGILEVIKIPHHGSKTAMRKDFYTRLSPRECVVSINADNKMRLPSEEFMTFLGDIGCTVRRTYVEGTIRVLYNLGT